MKKDRVPFGRYELIERLATGGMAELYRAVLTGPSGFSKTVAIKKILPQLGCNERFRNMFLNEGRLMAALTHRNLVQVFELGEVEGELYISLELVSGCDLADAIEQNKRAGRFVDVALAAFICLEVCRGLQYVHGLTDDQGRPQYIVHRDISPQNILLSDHGDVKLGDFGIAKSGVLEDSITRRNIKGKLEYLSPEQARGETVGPTSDVYAVGLVLFEMLTSRRYIQGADTLALMDAAADPEWRSIRELNLTVPESLENVVRRALRVGPEERYPTATAFSKALEEILKQVPRMPTINDVADLVEQTHRLHGVDHQANLAPSVATPAWGRAGKPSQHRAREATDDQKPRTVALSVDENRPAGSRSRVRAFFATVVVGAAVAAAIVWLSGIWNPGTVPNGVPDVPQKVSVAGPETASAAAPAVAPAVAPDIPVPAQKPLDGGSVSKPKEPVVAAARPAAARKKRPKRKVKARGQAGKPHRKGRGPIVDQAPKPPPEKPPTPADPPKEPPGETPDAGNTTVASVSTEPAAATEPPVDLEELGRRLARQRHRMKQRGVRSGDYPVIDRLIERVQRQSHEKKGQAALHSLQVLDEAVDRVKIDRAFVEIKMKRLQKLIMQKQKQAAFSKAVERILSLVLNSRFREANQAMNHIFDKLE